MNNYDAWNLSEWDYPSDGKMQQKIKYFVRFGLLAANLHNSQPWKFRIIKNKLLVIPDFKYHLKNVDPAKKYLFVSLGCCTKNIEVIAAYHHFKTDIKFLDDGSIEIYFVQTKENPDLGKLAPHITKRFSNKMPYSGKIIEAEHLKALQETFLPPGFELLFTQEKEKIKTIGKLQKEAIFEDVKEKSVIKELTDWLRPNDTVSDDGMPGFVAGMDPVQAKVGIFMLKRWPIFAKIQAIKEEKIIAGSPLLCVISAKTKDNKDFVNIGRVYEELALRAFSKGVFITPHQTVVANVNTAKRVSKMMGTKTTLLQMLFRLGYSNYPKFHTPRRILQKSLDAEYELASSLDIKDFEIKQIKIGNYLINYLKAGKGKPLLLIHGGNLGWGQWHMNISSLAKKFTVYAIDLPGGGRSTKIDFDSVDLNKDFVEVVEEFGKKVITGKFDVVGASVGGWVALQLALRNKIKIGKIVIADSLGLNSKREFSEKIIGIYPLAKLLSKTALRPSWDNLSLEMFMRDVFSDPHLLIKREFVDYFYETSQSSHNLLLISKLSASTNILVMGEELRSIKNEILVIWGRQDKLIPLEKAKNRLGLFPNKKVVIIEDTGHIPNIEKYDEFNKNVLKFLQ